MDEDMLMLVYPTKHAPTYERWIAVLRNISSTLAKQHVRVATVSPNLEGYSPRRAMAYSHEGLWPIASRGMACS